MRDTFYSEFAPLTFALGFFEMPADVVSSALLNWRSGHRTLVRRIRVSVTLREAFQMLDPLDGRKELIMSTQSRWAAYFANGADGAEPRVAASYLARILKCRSVAIECIPRTVKCQREGLPDKITYAGVIFELFGPEETDFLNYIRSIAVADEGGRWVFRIGGTPQPFETPERYSAKRKADRFTPEMLSAYCAALDIRPFEEAFYLPEGYLVSDVSPGAAGAPTLAGVRAAKNLKTAFLG